MPKVICFDLEGPLSPQDNAYEVMGLFDNGLRIFETISRYDDLLALEGRENYEAGDTLSLIAPFLVYHGISEEDVTGISRKAMLVPGARELIADLKNNDWDVYIISTSYEQHAYNIGRQLGVPNDNISCTAFPLDNYRKEFQGEDKTLIADAEKEIVEMYPPINDLKLKMRLDRFFFTDLPENPFGRIMREMRVMGGERKVKAAQRIAEEHSLDLKDLVVIGDSITDFKMLRAVNEVEGLAIAFNGNDYAIPHATVGIATTNMKQMKPILEQWEQGGREGVLSAFAGREDKKEPFIHVITGREDLRKIVEVHKKIRNEVRGRAAKLG
jgi:energy-converting hydrogenase A subunit R